jgi:hypothetical protein
LPVSPAHSNKETLMSQVKHNGRDYPSPRDGR